MFSYYSPLVSGVWSEGSPSSNPSRPQTDDRGTDSDCRSLVPIYVSWSGDVVDGVCETWGKQREIQHPLPSVASDG